jgi:hypothetical protein
MDVARGQFFVHTLDLFIDFIQDELVKRSATWHEENGSTIRPEDVIVAAFVQLRRIAAETMETTDVFCLNRGVPNATHTDVNYEVLLRNCNAKLTQWQETWQHEMQRGMSRSIPTSLTLKSFSIRGGVPSGILELFPFVCTTVPEQFRCPSLHGWST